MTYFERDVILGPTVLAKTVGPKIMSRTYVKELSLTLATDFLLQTVPNHQYTECQRTTVHRFESLSAGKLHNRFNSIYFKRCVQRELKTFFLSSHKI